MVRKVLLSFYDHLCFLFKKEKKITVWFYWLGWYWCPTPRRDPTTAYDGDSWLLVFTPGPVHPSLANLNASASAVAPILIASLVRTSRQHDPSNTQDSQPQISPQSDLREAVLQELPNSQSNVYLEYENAMKEVWKAFNFKWLLFIKKVHIEYFNKFQQLI